MMVLFFLIFGIIAISYFKGKYYECIQLEKVTKTIAEYAEG